MKRIDEIKEKLYERSLMIIDLVAYSELVQAFEEEVSRLQKSLSEATEWQPIETAPRDGTPVLLMFPWSEFPLPGYWHSPPGDESRAGWHELTAGEYSGPGGTLEGALGWRTLPRIPGGNGS